MLISAVMPFMSIYRLPHGQYGYKGHVINLPQDIRTFVSHLPRLPSQLDILLVRKEGSDNTHCDFRVRKLVVLRALKWLNQHKFYRNIEINQDALDQLPEDEALAVSEKWRWMLMMNSNSKLRMTQTFRILPLLFRLWSGK